MIHHCRNVIINQLISIKKLPSHQLQLHLENGKLKLEPMLILKIINIIKNYHLDIIITFLRVIQL